MNTQQRHFRARLDTVGAVLIRARTTARPFISNKQRASKKVSSLNVLAMLDYRPAKVK